jgi:uncharacterized repeat protein (TIGR01451 family)
MKNFLFLFSLLFSASAVFSQAPGIRWQQTMGGFGYDQVRFTVKTNDNGILMIGEMQTSGSTPSLSGLDLWVEKFNSEGVSQWRKLIGGNQQESVDAYQYNADGSIVILGTTSSTDGVLTNFHGQIDIWICKLDNSGNILWEKCFGGSATDFPSNIIKATGGGYIFSGYTESNNGDLTLNHGKSDAWVVKISEAGNILWQKSLGGSERDGSDVSGLIETPDESILFSTDTYSNDGDVSGFHESGGNTDIWLVKLSSTGSIIWNNCFGGNSADYIESVKLLPSGEIYLLGGTDSPELPSFHDPGTADISDIYFCRVSSTGTLLFQKCFGGTSVDLSFELLSVNSDGSCVIAGETESNNGDVVGHHGASSNFDIWVFKIDGAGNIVWQKTLGGSSNEFFIDDYQEIFQQGPYDFEKALGSIIKTIDGGFLLTSLTRSNDGDVTGFHPISIADPTGGDIWVVKLSSDGQLQWQRALGGARGDLPRRPLEFGVNDFILPGVTFSRDGDVQTNHGDRDVWLIRLGAVNRIKGTVFIDQNGNGIKDVGDSLFSNVLIKATKGSDIRSVIPYNGNFVIETDTGSYNTALALHQPYYTVTPVSHISNFSTYFNTDSFSFALQPIPGSKDLLINAIPLSVARPGFTVSYVINYKNVGVLPEPSGEILFVKDPKLSLLNSVPPINSSVGDTLKWNYTGLDPQEHGSITLQFQIAAPPVANNGDTLTSMAIITPVAGDLTPHDDTSVLVQRLQGSYDPNDKTENFGGHITNQQVASGEYLNYLIRFQNTGTDTAFNVIVRDTLDNKLDWSSFQMIASSHPYQLQINASNQLIWTFHGINLPDSNVNEPASHGFIAYRIKPQQHWPPVT